MNRGEIRWCVFGAPDRRRPVLLLTRDTVIGFLDEIIIVPVTRTVRGIATEVLLDEEDGMQTLCAANFDHLGLVHRSRLGKTIAMLRPERWPDAEEALLVACGFRHQEP
jgi:mRNA interferase MazF